MESRTRLALIYAGLVVGAMGLFALLYQWGMGAFEGKSRSVLESIQVVVQTFTTVGYGEDATYWTSAPMLVLVVAMQLSGVLLVFLAFPLFAAPWLEQRLETSAPTAIDTADHVVLCGHSDRAETLLDELDGVGVEAVVVEPDRQTARSLHESGCDVVHGDPESADVLAGASVADARAVVLDLEDDRNATAALAVREVSSSVRLVSFVSDPDLATYIDYAGADEVFSPRTLLGQRLAEKVTSAVSHQLGDTIEVGTDFALLELPVQAGSDLDGVTLDETWLWDRIGASVIALWDAGEFVTDPDPDREIDQDTVMLVAGNEAQLADAHELAQSVRQGSTGHVVLAGYGEVGRQVREDLGRAGIDTTVVDATDVPGVDVVGDVTATGTLREANLTDAGAIILALGDDTDAVFTTLVASELDDDVEIVARVNRPENARRLYSAGADYVLSLTRVAGRMVVQSVLEEDVLSLDTGVELIRCRAPALAGQTLGGADVRSRTGATVVAVERDGEVLTDLGPGFRIEADDSLVVAGDDAAIGRFYELSGAGDADG